MSNLIHSFMLRLEQTSQFTPTQLFTAKCVLGDLMTNYKVEEREGEVVSTDVLNPPGYKEYFVDKIVSGMSDNTIKQYKHQVDRFLGRTMKSINNIDGNDISLYLYGMMQGNGVTPRTANNTRRYLSSFFTWMTDNGYLEKNPMKTVHAVKEPQRVIQTITDEQFERILSYAKHQRERAMITVMAGSGLRRAEVVGMLLKDLDLEGMKFSVVGKGNKQRTCFLTARAAHELKLYLNERTDDCQYVFTGYKKPYGKLDSHTITSLCLKLSRASGIPFHPHTLRHYFADKAREVDLDILDISRLLGHQNIETTKLYITSNVDDLAYKHRKIK